MKADEIKKGLLLAISAKLEWHILALYQCSEHNERLWLAGSHYVQFNC